jgi:hypothetical protein
LQIDETTKEGTPWEKMPRQSEHPTLTTYVRYDFPRRSFHEIAAGGTENGGADVVDYTGGDGVGDDGDPTFCVPATKLTLGRQLSDKTLETNGQGTWYPLSGNYN